MKIMTENDFQELLHSDMGEYYIGRWDYYKRVIEIVKRLNPKKVLEIGPGKHCIVKDCDIMVKPEEDAWGRPIHEIGKEILYDATEKSWPINDKEYDLVLGLQVWEHLSNKQSRAFREVIRISHTAILSFPYLWNCPKTSKNYPEHHDIDEDLIADWTLHKEPKEIIKIERTGEKVSKGPRIIYFWEF